MTKPKGGRGKKAPYETQQMRVPVPIKEQVNNLITQFRDETLTESEDDSILVTSLERSLEIEALKDEIQNLKTALKESQTERQNLNTALQDTNQQINNLNTALMSAQSEIQNLSTSFNTKSESLKQFLETWKEKSEKASPTNNRWEWGRRILDDLETVLGVEKVEEKESDSAQLSLVE